MEGRIMAVGISVIVTVILILLSFYFIFGLNSKPDIVTSVASPDGVMEAYVVENPSIDPPNQSLFISRKGTDEFRLVACLPEDIEAAQEIIWTPDGSTVIFVTNWHMFITDANKFHTKKISLNPDLWKWQGNRKTFSSSGLDVRMEQFDIISSDSLRYRTNLMTLPVVISLKI